MPRLTDLCKACVWMLLILQCFALTATNAHEDIELQIQALDKRIQVESKNGELYLKRAELHRLHLSFDDALADYDKAEMYGITVQSLYFFRGRLYREATQFENALSNLNTALDANPNHIEALIERSKIPSRPAIAAVNDLDSAISLLPTPAPDLFLSRAKLLISIGPMQFDKMIAGLQDGITRLGSVVSLIEFAIAQCRAEKQWQAAQGMLKQLPDVLRESPKWLHIAGQLQGQMNNPDKAKALYNKALEKIAGLPTSRASSGAMIQLKNDIQAALEAPE